MSDFRVGVTPDWDTPRSSKLGHDPNSFYAWFEIDGMVYYDATGPTVEMAIFALAHHLGGALADRREG